MKAQQVCSLFLLLLVSCSNAAGLMRKYLAGPPSEFALHVLPSPQAGALASQSAAYNIEFNQLAADTVYYETTLPVDSTSGWGFAFFSPIEQQLALELTDPNGNSIDLAKYATPSSWPIGMESVPGTVYALDAFEPGVYYFKATSSSLDASTISTLLTNVYADAYLLLFNPGPVGLFTHTNSYSQLVGQEVGLVARVFDTTMWNGSSTIVPTAQLDMVVTATMVVELPDGANVDVLMHDDGLHYDLEADDGIYGGVLTAAAEGIYSAQAFITGQDGSGKGFVRSTQHLLYAINDYFDFTGVVYGVPESGDERMDLFLAITANSDCSGISFRAYAEVWGVDETGTQVPVCWVGAILDVDQYEGQDALRLELDLNWLAAAGASEPLTLKNMYAVLADNSIPVDSRTDVPVKVASSTRSSLGAIMSALPLVARGSSAVTATMREGRMPEALRNISAAGATPVYLVLNHGWCALTNPWKQNAADWTAPAYFEHLEASLSTDQFAQEVVQWAQDTLPGAAWAYVGHSQGGLVGVHIKSFYWSGLDLLDPASGRLLQSVGSPYQGCTGAGSSADFIKVFGVGCGSNYDLSRDGAQLWLSGVPSDKRQSVYYYTTSYRQGTWFGDYCNMAVNMVLKWPNDGVAELDFTDLPGANNMGNVESQCHTTGMKYDAQYYDSTRDQAMNAAAARVPLQL